MIAIAMEARPSRDSMSRLKDALLDLGRKEALKNQRDKRMQAVLEARARRSLARETEEEEKRLADPGSRWDEIMLLGRR